MSARIKVTRWLCVLTLAVVVALSVAACGSSAAPSGPGSVSTQSSSGY